jgi:plastocyanin domain-containing protein
MVNYKIVCFFGLFIMMLGSIAMAEMEANRATIDDDGVQRVVILGGGYFFKPDHVIVKVNVPVEMVISKEDGFIPHNFIIEAPEAGIEVDESLSSDPKVVKFTPTKVGKYPFYCSKKLLFFEDHREKGMEGVIEVVD